MMQYWARVLHDRHVRHSVCILRVHITETTPPQSEINPLATTITQRNKSVSLLSPGLRERAWSPDKTQDIPISTDLFSRKWHTLISVYVHTVNQLNPFYGG